MQQLNTTDVTKLGRWPIVTIDRAMFEEEQRKFSADYRRATRQFNIAALIASAALTAVLIYIVSTTL